MTATRGGRHHLTGAIPTPRGRLAAAQPFVPVGDVPAAYTRIPEKLSYWNNSQYGDCVSAEEAAAKAAMGVLIDESVVVQWAKDHGVLNGAMLDEVLDAMAKTGFKNSDGNEYRDGPKLSVDFTNPATLAAAIYQGPVKLGIASGQLDGLVQGKNGWVGVGFRHDNNEDHSVPLFGYGKMQQLADWLKVPLPGGVDPQSDGYHMFTWNTIGIIDRASMLAITGEAWVRNPTTIQVGTNPPAADPVFTPGPTPTPPPPPPPPPPGGNVIQLATALQAGTYPIGGSGLSPEQQATVRQAVTYLETLLPTISSGSVKELEAFDICTILKVAQAAACQKNPGGLLCRLLTLLVTLECGQPSGEAYTGQPNPGFGIRTDR